MSLSARRAWIEIASSLDDILAGVVALRKESVDRNCSGARADSVSKWVALRKESVDRNTQRRDFKRLGLLVALRKESVDRNLYLSSFALVFLWSLSARRAWIEIHNNKFVQLSAGRRSPQGERG